MSSPSSSITANKIHTDNKHSAPCILVVEDDASIAELLETILGNWGYRVLTAQNGREGLTKLGKHTVDGILLDMHMPIMDGRTMLDELRWLGYQMPVLAMSGGLDLPALRQLLGEGAQGFFLKPFNLHSLKQSCQEMFKKPTSTRLAPSSDMVSSKPSNPVEPH